MKEYPNIQKLIEDGLAVSFNDTGIGKRLVIVSDEGGQLIMFACGKMKYGNMMDKLELYAKDLLENGFSNDEINGTHEKIW
jgi:hypothetical protein